MSNCHASAPVNRQRAMRPNRERFELWMQYRLDLQARRDWVHPAESLDGVEGEQVLAVMAREWLTPILLFLAEGYTKSGQDGLGTLDKRAWALIYAIRPDLLNGDVMSDAARRWGVCEAALNRLVRRFEEYVPGFRSLGGGTKKRSQAVRDAVGRATFARAERKRAAQKAA